MYFMNEGCQGLLVAAAVTEEEAINGSALTVYRHWQLETQQQSSYDAEYHRQYQLLMYLM